VLCVDEKLQVQVPDRTAPILPPRPLPRVACRSEEPEAQYVQCRAWSSARMASVTRSLRITASAVLRAQSDANQVRTAVPALGRLMGTNCRCQPRPMPGRSGSPRTGWSRSRITWRRPACWSASSTSTLSMASGTCLGTCAGCRLLDSEPVPGRVGSQGSGLRGRRGSCDAQRGWLGLAEPHWLSRSWRLSGLAGGRRHPRRRRSLFRRRMIGTQWLTAQARHAQGFVKVAGGVLSTTLEFWLWHRLRDGSPGVSPRGGCGGGAGRGRLGRTSAV
jgi:hypothetical protein